MASLFARVRIVVGIAIMLIAGACATKPETGCVAGLNTPQCRDQCASFKTCALCAAQPSCGFCAVAPGDQGSCVPALNGEDHRSERPSICAHDWFYRPAKLSAPPGAPFCPPPAPGD
jgi:hypothetical protein